MNKSPIVNITIKKKMFSVAYAVVTGENEVKSAKKLLALYRDRIKQRIIGKDTMKEYNYLLSIYPSMVSEYKKALKLIDNALTTKELKKAFIVFRYAYERKRLAWNMQFLIELVLSLKYYASKVFSEEG